MIFLFFDRLLLLLLLLFFSFHTVNVHELDFKDKKKMEVIIKHGLIFFNRDLHRWCGAEVNELEN